jgi:RNA polymerase sigma factor (TIGR02999 family)
MLRAWGGGDREALEALVPRVYDELHRQAHRYLRGERHNHTLQTSALINEAYIHLAGQKDVQWQNRTHFFGIAASIMRRILVDYARTQQRVKRGGNNQALPLDVALSVVAEMTNEQTKIDLILLNSALDKLSEIDERQARIVELRYFSGLTLEETARVLDVSEMTVKRDWNVAKAWLRREITST